ncbi:MAG: hypothetical protein HN368_04730 [Spirochaetales bacterium]|jgi:hypothetical protein|nr:hypothetical protein [Spirochaetales bacterium]
MSIDPVQIPQIQPPKTPDREIPLIDGEDIKAILYLGIRGEIALPIERHKVDILA